MLPVCETCDGADCFPAHRYFPAHCWLILQTSTLSGGVVPAPSSNSRSKSSYTSSSGSGLAAAVDMQQLAGQPNTYVVCVPGLHSADVTTRQVAQKLAGSLGGRWTTRLVLSIQ
jgi:hypothetical protein